jgi:hypothetical protein
MQDQHHQAMENAAPETHFCFWTHLPEGVIDQVLDLVHGARPWRFDAQTQNMRATSKLWASQVNSRIEKLVLKAYMPSHALAPLLASLHEAKISEVTVGGKASLSWTPLPTWHAPIQMELSPLLTLPSLTRLVLGAPLALNGMLLPLAPLTSLTSLEVVLTSHGHGFARDGITALTRYECDLDVCISELHETATLIAGTESPANTALSLSLPTALLPIQPPTTHPPTHFFSSKSLRELKVVGDYNDLPLSALGGLSDLRTLEISGKSNTLAEEDGGGSSGGPAAAAVPGPPGLSGLKSLSALALRSCDIGDLSGLSALSALTRLDLGFARVADLGALPAAAPGLKALDLTGMRQVREG